MSIQEIKLQIMLHTYFLLQNKLDLKRYTISHISVNNTSYKLPALLQCSFISTSTVQLENYNCYSNWKAFVTELLKV